MYHGYFPMVSVFIPRITHLTPQVLHIIYHRREKVWVNIRCLHIYIYIICAWKWSVLDILIIFFYKSRHWESVNFDWAMFFIIYYFDLPHNLSDVPHWRRLFHQSICSHFTINYIPLSWWEFAHYKWVHTLQKREQTIKGSMQLRLSKGEHTVKKGEHTSKGSI